MQWCPVHAVQEVTGSPPAKVQDQLRRVEVLRCYSALRTAAACAAYADIAERFAPHHMRHSLEAVGQALV
jgi:hypothetical protein